MDSSELSNTREVIRTGDMNTMTIIYDQVGKQVTQEEYDDLATEVMSLRYSIEIANRAIQLGSHAIDILQEEIIRFRGEPLSVLNQVNIN